jgi:hypothetical protein
MVHFYLPSIQSTQMKVFASSEACLLEVSKGVSDMSAEKKESTPRNSPLIQF